MRKPLSPETKYKLKLFGVYVAAVVLCIFWLTAEVDITRRVKQDRIASEELLSIAERGIDDYAENSDPEGMTKAGERLLEFYSVAKRNSESRSVLIAFRRGYPKFTAQELSDLGGVAAAMLQDPERFRSCSDELVGAIKAMKDDVSSRSRRLSREAADVFGKIREEMSQNDE